LLILDEPQSPASARKHVSREFLEVACGRVERVGERLVDLTVGFADHRPQLAQGRVEVGAPLLELLDVSDRLRILLPG
jgi:hypothetical protein